MTSRLGRNLKVQFWHYHPRTLLVADSDLAKLWHSSDYCIHVLVLVILYECAHISVHTQTDFDLP